MPYKSKAQQGYFHAAEARGEISPRVVNDFDAASKGMKNLPEHVAKKPAKKEMPRQSMFQKKK